MGTPIQHQYQHADTARTAGLSLAWCVMLWILCLLASRFDERRVEGARQAALRQAGVTTNSPGSEPYVRTVEARSDGGARGAGPGDLFVTGPPK